MARRVVRVILLIGVIAGTFLITQALNDPQRGYRESGKFTTFELEGQPVPAFEASILGGGEFSRTSVDKPTMFVFFGTFCPHCKEMMPTTATLAKEYEGRAHVFAVNAREYASLPPQEREKKVAEYLEENGWEGLPTLIAPGKMQSALKIDAVPTVMLFDATGTVRYVGLASHSAGQLRSKLDEVM